MRLIRSLTGSLAVVLALVALCASAAAAADLRSPDAASLARARAQAHYYASYGRPVALAPAPRATGGDGFVWGDAAIGAAAGAALVGAAGAAALALRHRRAAPRPSVAAR